MLAAELGKPDLDEPCRFYTRFGGVRTAVIQLAKVHALSLLQLGEVKVRWVNCRIREHIKVVRCYRCQGYGHASGGCTRPGRNDACSRGREMTHRAKEVPDMPLIGSRKMSPMILGAVLAQYFWQSSSSLGVGSEVLTVQLRKGEGNPKPPDADGQEKRDRCAVH